MKLSVRQPRRLAWLALLLAAGGMLLSTSGAQAASKRGAVLVKDISPGNPTRSTSSSGPSELTDGRGTLFFTAQTRKHGTELWRSDGTRRGTRMVKDIRPGRGSSAPHELTTVGRATLNFVADDGIHGPELWRSDGTGRGTTMVKDIRPGPESGNAGDLTYVNGKTLFFVASDGTHSGLWRSDYLGTTLVKEFGQTLQNLTAVDGTLYFSAGGGLWRSDGTASGTTLIKQFLGPFQLTDVAGTLFFLAGDGTHFGVWRSDGTTAGTILVKELRAVTNDLTAVGGTLYFVSEPDLWRSDGTEAGTTPIAYAGPIPQGCSPCNTEGVFPQLADVGGTLYFVRNALGGTLLRTDGTPSGTRELRSDIIPRQLTAVRPHTLYFEGFDKKHGNELWRSDGTRRGTRLVRDIRRGGRGGNIFDLTAVRNTLFFSARDNHHGTELWRAGAKPGCKNTKKCK